MKRMHWLDDKKEEILKLYAEKGWKQTEIAKYFDVSQTAISIRLRRWGKSNTDFNRFRYFGDINREDVRRMYWDEEMHPVQIAEQYGCHKQVIVNRMKKWGIPLRTKSQARIGKLNPICGVGHTRKAKEKMSKAFENGRKMGFNSHWGVGSFYNTPNQGEVWMRSGWEVKVADYLTRNNVDWHYEYVWLKFDESFRYLPDFYLPKYDIYIEVKGRARDRDLKIKELMEISDYKFLFWDAEELLKRHIIINPGLAELYGKYRDVEPFVDDWKQI